MASLAKNIRRMGPSVTETTLVCFKKSPIHGLGCFARTDISQGRRIIEYVGERIDKLESVRRCEANNQYIFTLNQEQNLDGNVDWNPARFINHSCAPNCDAEVDSDRIWIVANSDIRPGDEITFNYGFDLEDYRDYPCQCGSPICAGYIVAAEFLDHVKRQRETAG